MENTPTIIEARSLKAPAPAQPPAARKKTNIAARLAAHVDTSGGLFACHDCSLAVMQSNGYPAISAPSPITGKTTMRNTHVVAWELHNGMPVPKGKIVLHDKGCSKTCCNPAHLRLGTHAENAADKVAEGRSNRRLTTAQVLEIAHLGVTSGASIPALATRFKVDPSTIRNILRGKTHSKLTGIERNVRKAGRPPRKAAEPTPAPAPVMGDIIILDQRRKRKAPELVLSHI